MIEPDIDKIPDIPLPDNEDLEKFILYYRQMTALYESAVRIVTTRLDIIEKECLSIGRHSPIRAVTTRIKEPQSIRHKLNARGFPLTLRSIFENLRDVAGVRVICEYIFDIYAHSKGFRTNQCNCFAISIVPFCYFAFSVMDL